MSQDHKPGNQKETDRITKAGGHVEFGRVNGTKKINLSRYDVVITFFFLFVGNLALSRALGDFEFKSAKDLPPEEQAVTGT